VSVPGIAVLGAFLMLSDIVYSCGAGSSTPSGPTITSIASNPNTDPVQFSNEYYDGCGIPSTPTGPKYWHVHYSNGQSGDISPKWPTSLFSGKLATVSYYFPQDDPGNIPPQGVNAIGAWNTALQRDKSTGGYVQISLQPSNNPQSSVQIFGSNNSNIVIGPTEGGGTVYGMIAPPYTNLTGAQIAVDQTQSDVALYQSLLHEIGHSLGLNHNLHQGSAMWPSSSGNSCLASIGAVPSSADTSWLEGTYDPYYVLYRKTYTGIGCPYGSFRYDPGQTDYFGNEVPLYTLVTDNIKKPVGACPVTRKKTVSKPQKHSQTPSVPIGGGALRLLSGWPSRNVMVHLDDHSEASSMSLTSLYLASTLVAEVTVGPTVHYVNDGPIRYAIREARIRRLLRHLVGPDARREVGDLIYISDVEGVHGEPFIDDLPLKEGSSVIVWLQQSDPGKAVTQIERALTSNSGRRQKMAVYRFTKPFVSKMTEAAPGAFRLVNDNYSRINTDLRSPEARAISSIGLLSGAGEQTRESAFISSALRSRHVVGAYDMAGYEVMLRQNSRQVTRWVHSLDVRTTRVMPSP